jgi:hypothetical protein
MRGVGKKALLRGHHTLFVDRLKGAGTAHRVTNLMIITMMRMMMT